MEIKNEDLGEYITIIWSESARVFKLLDMLHITAEGAVRRASQYNKPFYIFEDIEEAIIFIKGFTCNKVLLKLLKRL